MSLVLLAAWWLLNLYLVSDKLSYYASPFPADWTVLRPAGDLMSATLDTGALARWVIVDLALIPVAYLLWLRLVTWGKARRARVP